MRTVEEIRDLVEQCMRRDLADLDLDAKIADAIKHVDPRVAAVLVGPLKIVGPIIFEGAYFAGATAGMQIASDLRKP